MICKKCGKEMTTFMKECIFYGTQEESKKKVVRRDTENKQLTLSVTEREIEKTQREKPNVPKGIAIARRAYPINKENEAKKVRKFSKKTLYYSCCSAGWFLMGIAPMCNTVG